MQESDYDCMSYQDEFDAYIGGTQFLSWEDLRAKFKIFVETIMKGLGLPPLFTWQGAPIPTGLKGEIMERLPLEQLEDLITHYSSVVIRNARIKRRRAHVERFERGIGRAGHHSGDDNDRGTARRD